MKGEDIFAAVENKFNLKYVWNEGTDKPYEDFRYEFAHAFEQEGKQSSDFLLWLEEKYSMKDAWKNGGIANISYGYFKSEVVNELNRLFGSPVQFESSAFGPATLDEETST
jgi:hypothetical protein